MPSSACPNSRAPARSAEAGTTWCILTGTCRPSFVGNSVFNDHERKLQAIDSKYAKYSTEQLEVIFTHLADPEEKELVKAELSKRYLQHYRSLITSPESSKPAAASGPDTARPPDERAGAESADGPLSVVGGEPDSPEDVALLAGELDQLAELSLPGADQPGSQRTAQGQGPHQPPPAPARKKYCFIATAAFGSPLAPEVVLLQNFRDACLCRFLLGRKFIQVYYRLSPPLAERLAHSRFCRSLTRMLLVPLIYLVRKIFRLLAAKPASPRDSYRQNFQDNWRGLQVRPPS